MPQNFMTSNFIWCGRNPEDRQTEPRIVYFRKQFHQAEKLRISANCRYKLYINGRFVQEGPQKGSRETAYVDEADIKALCSEPVNTAAVEVLYYPEDPGKRNDSLYYSPFSCLYVEDTGPLKELDGKEGWKCCPADHIRLVREPFDPAPIHGSEIVSGSEAMRGWRETGYDDSGWEAAVPYTFFEVNKPVAPFALAERTIPAMEHTHQTFRDVVCVRESAARKNEELFSEWKKMLDGEAPVEMPANTTHIVEISAGKEMCGYPSLCVAGGKDAVIEILYAESYGIPQPDMQTPFGSRPVPPKKQDRTDYRKGSLQGMQDIYIVSGFGTKEKPEIYTPFLFRTFRYIRVKVTTKEQGMSLIKYDYLSTGYPLEVKTHLTTSDESLNRIWDISLRTLKRCMHETYVDCPYYEQLQYTMDSRAEIMFTYADYNVKLA